MKAEQLKEKAKHETDHPNYYGVIYYRFSESELQEYATEIAREQREACQKHARFGMRGELLTNIMETPLVTNKMY